MEMSEWLKGKPPAVIAMAERVKPGQCITVRDTDYFVVGFGEREDGKVDLLVSFVDPRIDYEAAFADHEKNRTVICAEHLTELIGH